MRKSLLVALLLLGLSLPTAAAAAPADGLAVDARGTEQYMKAGHGLVAAAYPGRCGVRVDYPHASYTTSAQIHTNVTSYCEVLPLQSNTVSGKTYRSRWWGWQLVATLSPATLYAPNPKVQNFRRTVVANCTVGDWYRYHTEGFGTISTGSQTFSAAAYEENDTEIRCNA